MSMSTYAHTMAHYNRWMNQRLYATCATLTDAERKRDVGAFFHSVHGTLNHILLADRVWMGRFAGQTPGFSSLDQELYADFATLRAERERDDDAIMAWASALSEDDFSRTLSFTGVTDPEIRSYPWGLVVIHFFNHQTHHRGQITTLLTQLGIDPGITDLLRAPGLPVAP
ncbi:MAG: DinB family protein [Acidiferrobacter sp.]